MATFNAENVALFLSQQSFVCVEYQVRGKISVAFGCTMITAGKWFNRLLESGRITIKDNQIIVT